MFTLLANTEEFNQLKIFYQTNNDFDELELKETEKKKSLKNTKFNNIQDKKIQFDNQILMSVQIEKFQKIFVQHTIKENEEQEINKELIVFLDQ
ncbi:19893_t:CDS:2 [Cetraspora pellucida]|uniref:19893_t:CDS:1 n=1 Tax=Cetraspora pellucida TaxID=1433469 RepID=A0A9N9G3C2_9GLOM|nr:19893_t:CDS:2 [Cetraspora pellucida]